MPVTTETIERTFRLKPKAQIGIKNVTGSITIRPGVDGVMRIRTDKRGNEKQIENTQIEMEQSTNGDVMVKVRSVEDGMPWIMKREVCQVDFYAEIPAREVVTASTVEGQIDVKGISGSIVCQGVSADILLNELEGEIRAKSVSGNIEGRALNGNGNFDSVSGDIDMINCAFSKLSCSGVSGTIDFNGIIHGEGAVLSSISGDVILGLRPDERVSIGGKTLSGFVQLMPAANIRRWGLGQFSAELNGGGTHLRIHTLSGDIITSLDSEEDPRLARQTSRVPMR